MAGAWGDATSTWSDASATWADEGAVVGAGHAPRITVHGATPTGSVRVIVPTASAAPAVVPSITATSTPPRVVSAD